jgi:hypothetical protein
VVEKNFNTTLTTFERKGMKSTDEYADTVIKLTKDSANNIIKIGKVFLEAENKLEESEYQKFLQKTNYVDKSSMIRKWENIGESYERLMSISNLLPATFSTIYKLSTLKPDLLDLLVTSGKINPSISLREINDELNPKMKNQIKPKIIIEFKNRNCEFLLKELNDHIKDNYSSHINLKINEIAEELINSLNNSLTLLNAA